MLRGEPGRLRTRRRLLVLSAPVVVLLVVAAIKMMSLAIVGDSAVSDFARGDGAALRADASRLGVLNLVEPARAPFAAGAADVLDGRLTDADGHFSQALARTPDVQSCDVRINVELVRETQGDVEAAAGRAAAAGERYRSALAGRRRCARELLRGQRRPAGRATADTPGCPQPAASETRCAAVCPGTPARRTECAATAPTAGSGPGRRAGQRSPGAWPDRCRPERHRARPAAQSRGGAAG